MFKKIQNILYAKKEYDEVSRLQTWIMMQEFQLQKKKDNPTESFNVHIFVSYTKSYIIFRPEIVGLEYSGNGWLWRTSSYWASILKG